MEDSPVNKSSTESFESLYNMGKMIGSGGFGRVYNATRKFDGKKVAIKRMRKIDNDRYLNIPGHPEPLVTEVALLLMMRREPISPFVIQLYDWFEHPKTFTLVMEYPEPCESLLDFITLHPRLYEPAARVIMQQAVLAVQHCIEHGVFHNDIHAENFLLKKHSFDLKLIDFGCGQLFSSDGYESNIYIGIQDHCPPEVLTEPRFHAVPANVWALGVLLYKMSNACRPFCNRTEITHAKVTFQNSNLSKGKNIHAVLGGRLELET
ncbi:serine/threonine-protein kinase pim-2-like [Rhinichthys klamathensis goyatoka]|uniref:serine/threonine-protein kinase pim-2-like n=2 Tax=Rhinichthys klamathensis goyatoka TaxID=3034132 RepID=UPI0024B57192|nr:serine/threonine-protein kinase pim-2-like [Rhinichthys klamathensis goyatoka]